MRRMLCVAALCGMLFPAVTSAAAKTYALKSPDGGKAIEVTVGDTLSYRVLSDGAPVVEKVTLAMITPAARFGVGPRLKKVVRKKISESFTPVVALKFSSITDECNAMTMTFDGGYSVEFRAYDDGVAHRFVTSLPGRMEVTDEIYRVVPAQGTLAHLQQTAGFKTSYEEPYTLVSVGEWTPSGMMATLPALLQAPGGEYVLMSESGLRDYPAMFLRGDGRGGMHSVFPRVPLRFGDDGDRSVKILQEAPYVALTDGTRAFPWRFMAIGSGKDMMLQTFVARLGGRNTLADTSWIKPGMASWEWWNGAAPYGDGVDFESGCNTATYKYFIDFASRYGVPYIIMDEGWALDTRDPYTPNPDVDVREIVRYGRDKGVGVFLWLPWLTVENNFGLFETFAGWGVKGVKIDFMDRSDQWMVDFYERVCRAAAENRLMVDMHGSFKPAGLEQRYPNLLSYEGVRGMEQMGGCRPDNSLYLPFMRNAVGPMDYTPGAMTSMQPECYVSARPNSASIGTRAYQMALFVVFESGIQMLADSPTAYYRNDDCTRFITSVPVTWDDTRVLEALPGQYVIVARRKGDAWYLGGMTNGAEKARTFDVSLDFLDDGRSYAMESFEDGINAHQQAMDYRRRESAVDSRTTLSVTMARNGGWAAVVRPVAP